jgi:hypothetical protein
VGQKLLFSNSLDVPLPENLNDADIYPGMAEIPAAQGRVTEMLFCLTRYEVGVFLAEHAKTLHCPSTAVSDRDQLINRLENLVDAKYLRYCDPAVPLHRIASGGARSAILKMRLIAHHPSLYPDKGKSLPQSEHDMIFATCVEMVELLIQGYSSQDIERFAWHLETAFQLDAVVLMLIESQTQPPTAPLTQKCWDLVSEVFKYRQGLLEDDKYGLHAAVRHLVLKCWNARETAARGGHAPLAPLAVVNMLKEVSGRQELSERHENAQGTLDSLSTTTAAERNAPLTMPMVNAIGVTEAPSMEEMNSEFTDVDHTLFPDWDLTDISSWDRWTDLLTV